MGRTLVECDVCLKCMCSGTVMRLQPVPCFSERKKTNLKTIEKQVVSGSQMSSHHEADVQREGDPRHDLHQPASEPPALLTHGLCTG